MLEDKEFGRVVEALPSRVDAVAMKEVSVPYCFVCLLHLANEKHLELLQDGIASLTITQTPPLVANPAQ